MQRKEATNPSDRKPSLGRTLWQLFYRGGAMTRPGAFSQADAEGLIEDMAGDSKTKKESDSLEGMSDDMLRGYAELSEDPTTQLGARMELEDRRARQAKKRQEPKHDDVNDDHNYIVD